MNRHYYLLSLLLVLLLGGAPIMAIAENTANGDALLCRFPTLYNNTIVFEAGGNLWRVNRDGGVASRLTTDPGYDMMPRFSPDGQTIAFTGQYAGNVDVYTIPAEGGPVTRLTYHSDVVSKAPTRWGPDNMVMTWTPDGKNIVFLSRRATWNSWFGQPFEVSKMGGLPEQLPLPKGGVMSYSPDGSKIAYNRIFRNFRTWKRYEGGLAQDIWIYDFKTHQTEQVTTWKGTDTYPMWYKNTIYFASDRGENHRLNIWAYDVNTKAFRQITHFKDYDVDWPSLGNNGIVFQDGGSLYVLDLPSEQLHKINVTVPTDGTQTMPRWVNAGKMIRSFDVAPNGKRVVFGARGDIFTVPAKHGATRDLTQTSNAQEQNPAWSPDGKWVAYLTDASGENELAIRPSDGSGSQEDVTHFKTGYFYNPLWSPNSDMLAFSDNNHVLWYINLKDKKPVRIDQDKVGPIWDYHWSPDGKYISYSKTNASGLSQIYIYSLTDNKSYKVSTGMYSDNDPVFGPEGKYLYFISNRHENPTFSETEFNVATEKMDGIYLVTLQKDEKSPFAPVSDEGTPEAKKKAESEGPWKAGNSAPVKIDFDGLMERVVALPIPSGDYGNLQVTGEKVYYQTRPLMKIDGPLQGSGQSSIMVYNLKTKKGGTVVENGVGAFALSADGSTIAYMQHGKFFLMPASDMGAKGSEEVNTSDMKMLIYPHQEWDEMYHQAWRLFRDFFYSTEMNGVNWKEVGANYAKLLPKLGCREDVNYLIGEMIGELNNSHCYVWGGDDNYTLKPNHTGVLGVDFGLKDGHYYFKKIYPGDNSREGYESPLMQPGVNVKTGDYLLAVNGHELKAPMNPYSLFVNTVGQQTTLTVADSPDGKGKHDIVVKPIDNSLNLRLNAWITHNRDYVNKKSDGKIGYIYLSDMEALGMDQFIHQFYPQISKQGLIMDDRFNGGGFIDQIVLERLRRVLIGMSTNRTHAAMRYPEQVLNGYKVCLLNHYSASDGDMFPFYFRKYGLGPLIGTRTWGGVRGYNDDWTLLDGGNLIVSENSIYGLDSKWAIENHGVTPDIKVDNLPGDVMAGKDAQLDTAIDYIMKKLKEHPLPLPQPPAEIPAYPSGNDAGGTN
ncbi:MAG: PD40 domain-containing protein [Bacteroidales bacterium]|nr:PD40 domain-containing protein [Bacteroidales bacterium]